ncbi:MAG: hypothetical protein ACI4NO_07355 [Oxalobacter sp.]
MIKRVRAFLITAIGLIVLGSTCSAENSQTANKQDTPKVVKKVDKPTHIDLVMILDKSGKHVQLDI